MSPLPTFTAIFVPLFIRFAQPHTPELTPESALSALGDRNTVAVPVGDRKLSGSGYKDGERVAVSEFHLYFAIDINKVGVEIGTLNQRSRGAGSSTNVHRAQICGSIVLYRLLCLVEMQLAQIAGGISPVVVENPVCDIARLLISTANMKGA